jgi:hypothetical protein
MKEKSLLLSTTSIPPRWTKKKAKSLQWGWVLTSNNFLKLNIRDIMQISNADLLAQYLIIVARDD